ncbi:YbjN domain-containing protein [Corynebacterium mastitidis]|uniref:YbjN domain-containing protein n=1 Tax=Corynebacterium mastitidis TaxID=161890 RepID=UPI00254E2293|nr:YbjN domain-containing protein [Corynebacterium mastitidis]MDK8449839.1 YbjN domain-containing protein [Corynebacterium mastitidis]
MNQELAPLSFDRVTAAMQEFNITLWPTEDPNVATANLNGFRVTFALLNSVLIVRADHPTDLASDSGVPTLHLAANQVNCSGFGAKAVVSDREENLVVRTECALPIAAGVSSEQLTSALSGAVDEVLAGQDRVARTAEELLDQRG